MNYVGREPAPAGVVLFGDTNPVGLIGWFHAVPDGSYLRMNGQAVLKTSYPDLWQFAQNFLTADQVANPGLYKDLGATFALPKLDGLFIRAQGQFDANRVSAAIGVRQDDGMTQHTHALTTGPDSSSGNGLITNRSASSAGSVVATGVNSTTAIPETRPVNVALVPCVKALRALLVPSGTIPSQTTTLLLTQTAAGVAQLDFANLVGYPSYRFIFRNVVPVTDATNFQFRTSIDNGATFDAAANYGYASSGIDAAAGAAQTAFSGAAAAAVIAGSVSNNALQGVTGEMLTGDLLITPVNHRQHFTSNVFYQRSTGQAHMNGGASQQSGAGAVNAIRFFFGAGNIASGTISAYGVRG